jgi:transposase-like protein
MKMIKNSKLSERKVRKIAHHFCVDIPASKTAELLSINRNTVNRFYGLFRRIIYAHRHQELKKLNGVIELDESYFGATRVRGQQGKRKRGRGTLKQPVFGIFEREGEVYTEIIPNCKRDTLQGIILGKVDISSVINSDGWRGYDGLVDVGYDKHYRVIHSKGEFSLKNGIHINGIESFWSFAKRRLAKFNGVKVNFALHLKECEWRWSKTTDQLYKKLKKLIKNYDCGACEYVDNTTQAS